jgi:DNA-binding Lrp family transcriptional regulator
MARGPTFGDKTFPASGVCTPGLINVMQLKCTGWCCRTSGGGLTTGRRSKLCLRQGAEATRQLDEFDEAIVAALQQDGRRSLRSIASEVGLSADAVANRIGRLTGDALLKVVGVVDPRSVGINAQATVALECRGDLKDISLDLAQHGEVTFLVVMLGRYNVLCEISASDDSEIADFVSGVATKSASVRSVEVWKHLEVHKWDTGTRNNYAGNSASASTPTRELDNLDIALLRLLIDNPRLAYADLAAAVKAPYAMVRRRCQALFDSGTIRTEAVLNRVSTKRSTMALVCLDVGASKVGDALDAVASVAEVEILVRVSGPHTALAEVACSSVDDLTRVNDLIGAVDGIARTELLPYVRIEKLPASWTFPRLSQASAT